MGNIVSNAVVPNQLPTPPAAQAVTSPQAGVPPVVPEAPVQAAPTPAVTLATPTPVIQASTMKPPELTQNGTPATFTIEGVDSAAPSGFNSDPFGPLPPAPEVASPDSSAQLPSITPEPVPAPPPEPPITPVQAPAPSMSQSAADLLAKMPDISLMMKDLEKSGCLLPELQVKATQHIDSSPLAALQPKKLKDQSYFSSPTDVEPAKLLPEIQLGSTRSPVAKAPPQELPLYVFVAIFSLVQAFQGAAIVLHFMFVKYPSFEQMIVANIMSTSDVDSTVVKAIMVGIMAVVGLLFGSLLLLKRSKNKSVDLYIVISIIIINFLVQNIIPKNALASGNPLNLPDILGQILANNKR